MIIREYGNFGDPGVNPGDLISEMGAINLIRNCGLNPDHEDYMFLIGTPWFWNGCLQSEKYAWLQKQIDINPDKIFVAIGAGSCFAFNETVDQALEKDPQLKEIGAWWNEHFSMVTTRDLIAEELLQRTGCPKAKALPCPSLWAIEKNAATESPGGTALVDSPPWHSEFINLSIREIGRVVGGPRTEITYYRDTWSHYKLKKLLEYLSEHDRIISKRIHCALPLAPFRPAMIVPCDGRVETTRLIGLPEWPGEELSDPLSVRQIMEAAVPEYRDLLGLLN